MLPTYRESSVNFVNCLAYLRHEPLRGDVVAVRYSGQSIMLMNASWRCRARPSNLWMGAS